MKYKQLERLIEIVATLRSENGCQWDREQTHQSLKNVKAILNEAGYDFCDVVKTTVFLSDIADFAAMNEVYKQYYQSECPARSAFAVKSLPMGALVEIETIAGK